MKIHQLKKNTDFGLRLWMTQVVASCSLYADIYMNYFSLCAGVIKNPCNCVIHPRKPLECCSPIVIGMTCLPRANNRLTLTP